MRLRIDMRLGRGILTHRRGPGAGELRPPGRAAARPGV